MRETHISDFKSVKEKLGAFAVNIIERGRDLTYGLPGTNYKARGAKLGRVDKKVRKRKEMGKKTEKRTSKVRRKK